MIQWMLAVWSLVPLPFLNPAWTSGSSWFTYCWSLGWRILSIIIYRGLLKWNTWIFPWWTVCSHRKEWVDLCIYTHTNIYMLMKPKKEVRIIYTMLTVVNSWWGRGKVFFTFFSCLLLWVNISQWTCMTFFFHWSIIDVQYYMLPTYSIVETVLVAQSCPTLCDPTDCSPPGSSVHGILQAGILKWIAIPFSRGSSQPRDRSQVSCIAGRFFTI